MLHSKGVLSNHSMSLHFIKEHPIISMKLHFIGASSHLNEVTFHRCIYSNHSTMLHFIVGANHFNEITFNSVRIYLIGTSNQFNEVLFKGTSNQFNEVLFIGTPNHFHEVVFYGNIQSFQ